MLKAQMQTLETKFKGMGSYVLWDMSCIAQLSFNLSLNLSWKLRLVLMSLNPPNHVFHVMRIKVDWVKYSRPEQFISLKSVLIQFLSTHEAKNAQHLYWLASYSWVSALAELGPTYTKLMSSESWDWNNFQTLYYRI